MVSFRSTIAALAIGVLAPATLAAQHVEKGAFIVTLGSDTVAVEQFAKKGNVVTGDLLQRAPFTRVGHYVVTLDAKGAPTHFDYTVSRPGGAAMTGPFARSITMNFGADSDITVATTDTAARIGIAAIPGAVPFINNSYMMYEIALAHMQAMKRDSMDLEMLGPGSKTPNPLAAHEEGDSVIINWFGYPLIMKINKYGELTYVNASNTTVKVKVKRVPSVDIAALGKMFAAREATGHGLAAISARDTVNADIGATHLWVDYGRPFKRGRMVFGDVIRMDSIWRTGANAATQFKTSSDIVINGTTVPAGEYTLWTIPSKSGATLVINSEIGQWGTDYHADKDLVHIPITTKTLSAPVEEFTIAITPSGSSGGLMTMSWDMTEMDVPFTVK